MDRKNEEYFVRTFVKKSRQERLLHELTSEKKRSRGLERFCHQSSELLDPGRILMKDGNLENLPGFRNFADRHNESCTLLSPDPSLDTQIMLFKQAAEAAALCADAVIIVGDGFSAVFAEAYMGTREKYLLAEDGI